MIEKIKKLIVEWIKTFSQQKSFLSSKKIERFSFVGLSQVILLGTFIYLIITKSLTSTDAVILVTPALICAGYSLKMTEDEKQLNKEENGIN